MVSRIKIVLPQPEYSALLELAQNELRAPHEQIRFLVRQELVRRGLLTDTVGTREQPRPPQTQAMPQVRA